jgi:gamma-glutamyl-gamma-aminobutyrate hydrolase PuuD
MQGASAQVMRLTHAKLKPFFTAIHSVKVAKDSVLEAQPRKHKAFKVISTKNPN